MTTKHTRRVAATIVIAALLLPTLAACDTACKHEGDTRTRRVGHGIVHERCELHNDGLRWTAV
jgi:hypothetical protein